MNGVLITFGGVGGVLIFGGAMLTVVRGIFRQVGATEANTVALKELQRAVEGVSDRLNDHAERIARLEGARH